MDLWTVIWRIQRRCQWGRAGLFRFMVNWWQWPLSRSWWDEEAYMYRAEEGRPRLRIWCEKIPRWARARCAKPREGGGKLHETKGHFLCSPTFVCMRGIASRSVSSLSSEFTLWNFRSIMDYTELLTSFQQSIKIKSIFFSHSVTSRWLCNTVYVYIFLWRSCV